MGAFAGLRDAKIFERGTPLSVGKFKVEITKCQVLRTRAKGDAFIVEFKILESSDTVKHPLGSIRSWYQSLQDSTIAFGEIKAFAAAVLGIPPSDKEAIRTKVDPEIETIMERAISAEQALKGAKVAVECTHKLTKAGKDFTRHDWAPVA